ncbi:sulfotransferase family 2 domain-containing protein [Rhizobium sp. LjRoot254]|uniref:sulfotransferase family 2 domain-containing protein n=1 Tax=Rhizobium sp. LjRoot254 TaxID=3342297 RepID=UPI003ED1623E
MKTDRFGLLHIGKTGGTAVNAVLRAAKERKIVRRIGLYGHQTGLQDIVDLDKTRNVVFFIREPVSRYISAFNSRLRRGYPRHGNVWTDREEIAFEHFKTPNQLAEALSAGDAELRRHAEDAMTAIKHLRRDYRHYLGSVELLEQERDRIYFIGATESFESDFGLLRQLLGVPDDLELPTDDYGAHRTPDGFEKTVSELGRRNIENYCADDYNIYRWCAKRREELLPLRQAEAAEKASAK